MNAFEVLFLLLAAHAVADFPLQGDFLAKFKGRKLAFSSDRQQQANPIWIWCMSAHCFIHGGFVFLITGSVVLGIAEVIWHFGIDYAKCEGDITFDVDQVLHICCKVLWVLLLALGVT